MFSFIIPKKELLMNYEPKMVPLRVFWGNIQQGRGARMRRSINRRPAKRKLFEAAGLILTKFRARAGYTLEEAAEAIGTSASYLSEIENGIKNPSDKMLKKLAETYGVPEQVLFEKFGRLPDWMLIELGNNESLKQLLTEVKNSRILRTEQEKQEVMEKVLEYFKELLTRMEHQEGEK